MEWERMPDSRFTAEDENGVVYEVVPKLTPQGTVWHLTVRKELGSFSSLKKAKDHVVRNREWTDLFNDSSSFGNFGYE